MNIFDSAVFYVKYNPRGGFLLFIKTFVVADVIK